MKIVNNGDVIFQSVLLDYNGKKHDVTIKLINAIYDVDIENCLATHFDIKKWDKVEIITEKWDKHH